jgi:hypothetical protein
VVGDSCLGRVPCQLPVDTVSHTLDALHVLCSHTPRNHSLYRLKSECRFRALFVMAGRGMPFIIMAMVSEREIGSNLFLNDFCG